MMWEAGSGLFEHEVGKNIFSGYEKQGEGG